MSGKVARGTFDGDGTRGNFVCSWNDVICVEFRDELHIPNSGEGGIDFRDIIPMAAQNRVL